MKFLKYLQRALPYIVAVAVFAGVSMLYFAPQYEGKTLIMSDMQMYEGMKKDIVDHRAATGEDPQWTGGMFGGMPAYLITVKYPAMVLRTAAQKVMNLVGEPAALMMLAMVGFWLMLLMFGVNPWVAIPAALAYGLSTFNVLIIEAGHITQMRALGYAPMVVGAVWWLFSRNLWVGGALTALTGALTIAAAHHQITYYFGLIVAVLWINELVTAIRAGHEKGLPQGLWGRFVKATAVMAVAGVLALGANFSHLWYTFEHTPETTRGGSELADDDHADASGLDLEYATAWSYGVGESLNMMIPNFRGGASSGGFEAGDEVAKALRQSGINPSVAAQLPAYWGAQPFTGGPTYIGAVVVFLFLLGMFVLRGSKKWWALGVSALALLLAWGHNTLWFTELAFAVLPGYNKFRVVAMALVVLQWAMPFIGALVVAELWKGGFSRGRFLKGLAWSVAITGGVALFFALFGGMIYDFSAAGDERFAQIPGLVEAMQSERAAMFRADAWRSLVFVVLAAGVVWAWVSLRKMRRGVAVAAIGVLVLADLVPVDLRFVSHDDFVARGRVEIKPDAADRTIMADKELGFRVLNADNPFNEARTSYFHRSIGGYHGAKLRRYQDVVDSYLAGFDHEVLNMLNTKYIITTDRNTGERHAELNPDANGAAWFVDDVRMVGGARAELEALATLDTKRKAVVDERFTTMTQVVAGGRNLADSAATIRLTEYRPNYLRYETASAAERLAVFSEIYYDKGWTASIDGVVTPYLRSDYILRAMVVPAGGHTIEWQFRAPRFRTVEGVTLASSIAILMWLIGAVIWTKRSKQGRANRSKQNTTSYGSGR